MTRTQWLKEVCRLEKGKSQIKKCDADELRKKFEDDAIYGFLKKADRKDTLIGYMVKNAQRREKKMTDRQKQNFIKRYEAKYAQKPVKKKAKKK